MERINLQVSDGTGDLLTRLAGGERKRGAWLSEVARSLAENQARAMGSEVETMRYAVSGMAGQVKYLESRLLELERLEGEIDNLRSQLAAMIATNA